jgi:ECF transporter S component (folate family)
MKKIKELYANSLKEFASTKNLALIGMMGALAIVLSLVASISIGPYIKIGFSGLPNRIVETLFGPVVGCIFGGAMDIIKYMIKPDGPFFFGFTFDAMLAGVIYGTLLYRKPVSIKRILVADFLVKAIVNCGFNTLWISVLYVSNGKTILTFFLSLLPLRLLKNAIMLPIDCAILYACLTYAKKLSHRFGYTTAQH